MARYGFAGGSFHVRETRAICSVPLAMKRIWRATWQAGYECAMNADSKQTPTGFALINHFSMTFHFHRNS